MSDQSKAYDVVIVGGGSAGSALAGRLSADPTRSVLVLEAGSGYRTVEEIPEEILSASEFGAMLPGHPNNWSHLGSLTPDLAFTVPRGKILGGSSAVNGALFTRGTPEDFEAWVDAGLDEWSYEEVLRHYIKLEHDYDYRGPEHGATGPMPVKRPTELLSPITEAFLAACRERGFREEEDKNRPAPPGYGFLPMNVLEGRRVNAAIAYLLPNLGRPNLTVRTEAFVRRVLMEGRLAVGVEVEIDGTTQEIRASEVVLSAGAVKSPHLLMLSGIGPADELQSLGIPIVHESPAVGKGFSDHPAVWVTYQLADAVPFDPLMGVMQAGLTVTAEGSEVVGDGEILAGVRPLGEAAFGSRMDAIRTALKMASRPIRTWRAMRGASLKRFLEQAKQGADLALFCGLQQPLSRGDVKITSPDPHQSPELSFRYLQDPSDRARLGSIVRTACALLETEGFRRLGARRTSPDDSDLASSESLERWLLSHLYSSAHSTGTCKMGRPGDVDAVVDQHGKVHGVEGLRVVDVSIMPRITRRGPAASAIMIGEKIAETF